MGELIIKLQSNKTGSETSFVMRYTDRAETTALVQCGNLRTDYARKEFKTKDELVKALMKVMNNKFVSVRRVRTLRTLFEFYYGGMKVGRNEMFLITRDFIGDLAAIQLVNLIDRDIHIQEQLTNQSN